MVKAMKTWWRWRLMHKSRTHLDLDLVKLKTWRKEAEVLV